MWLEEKIVIVLVLEQYHVGKAKASYPLWLLVDCLMKLGMYCQSSKYVIVYK